MMSICYDEQAKSLAKDIAYGQINFLSSLRNRLFGVHLS